jgi:hypothetical protein
LALGRSVAELRLTLGAAEVDCWRMYYAEEPWGATRDNIHAAMIASIIANAHRGKNSRPFKTDDFMLVGPTERAAREQQRKAGFIGWLRAIGKRKS